MPDCAFDELAFDDVAFDTCQPTPPPPSRPWSVRKRIPITDDDDSLLAAWMMYFMQPYQDEEQ
jgi:hypothetical protein